ncbi:SRPBCC family protein [Paraglaciecola chathamensis]|uniref:SRPBCC family protein n=1 Tax=Paraglaciecola chathamensis TaxID=368405 RepID=UPI0005873089|nr:SRPBCC family protein [Paraglaciecola agarilytica]
MLKKIGLGIVVVVLFFILVGWLLPSEFKVVRTVRIEAPAEIIFNHVKDLRKWQHWGVWFERDPDMKVVYEGPDSAVGMKSSWQSETQGNGEMEIVAIEENERFIYTLTFPEMGVGSTGELTLREKEGDTVVIWHDYGDVGANPLLHYVAFFMDRMIGDDLQMGLENLKVISEAEFQSM